MVEGVDIIQVILRLVEGLGIQVAQEEEEDLVSTKREGNLQITLGNILLEVTAQEPRRARKPVPDKIHSRRERQRGMII